MFQYNGMLYDTSYVLVINIIITYINYYEQFDFALDNMIETHIIARKINANKINCIYIERAGLGMFPILLVTGFF